MDSLQIVELLFPFLGDHFKPSYWVADFVAKQEKHGELQPIIVRVEGFEYLTLWYLLLDRDCNLKGYFNLEKCEYDEGWAENPIGSYCKKKKRSKFDKGIIESYEIRETDHVDARTTVIDSLMYRTTINSDGKLNTNRIDSVRITKRWRK